MSRISLKVTGGEETLQVNLKNSLGQVSATINSEALDQVWSALAVCANETMLVDLLQVLIKGLEPVNHSLGSDREKLAAGWPTIYDQSIDKMRFITTKDLRLLQARLNSRHRVRQALDDIKQAFVEEQKLVDKIMKEL
jgi:hypothetical protein